MSEQAVRDLFERATELPLEERTPFLIEECGDDLLLLQEIQELLAADTDAAEETFWQHSALRNQVIADAARSDIGEIIGHYRLVELLGKGGMGTVYRAERMDAAFDKSVAIKLINGLFHSAEVITHFRAERQILANLEHPNIARLIDGGAREDGLPYLIMEYIEGTSPYDYCREHDLSTTERLVLFRQICSAVHFAHQNMVIHRDLKPANILVMADGTPKLLDFGIAKVLNPDPQRKGDDLTEPGMLKLTARYASPEQVRGEPVTTASDVYSLGVILYELLSGHSPYGEKDRAPHELMSAVCDEEPAKPSVWMPKLKGDLDNIILRALRKPPQERYASADQFSEDILRHLEQRPVDARGDAPLYVAARFVRRNRVVVGIAALFLCSLIGGLIEVTIARARAERRFNQVRQLAHSVIFDYSDAIDRLPGSTPVRERLVKDALTYLDSLSQEAGSPELQREIVDAYVRVSDVQGNEYQNNVGNPASALGSARKAVDEANRLLRKDHTLPTLNSAASAFSTLGSLLYSTGDLPAADHAYQQAVALREEITRQTPRDLNNELALATCLNHMGDLYGGYGFQNLGKTTEARAFYQRAKTLVERMQVQFPSELRVEKESYEVLLPISASENAAGEHVEAARDLGEALTQIAKVSLAEPHDTNVQYELANGESRLSQMLLDARQPEAAATHVERSASLLQALQSADPTNANFRRGLSVVQSQWAAALRASGRIAEGLAHNTLALQLAQSLSRDAPASTQYRMDVGVTERKFSEGLLAAGKAADALQHADAASEILCHTTFNAANPNSLANCGRARLALGNAYLALHDPKAAEAALRKAGSIAAKQAAEDPKGAIPRSDTARAQAALAAALAQKGDNDAAAESYVAALQSWTLLKQANLITAEDAYRSDQSAQALKKLKRR